MPYKKDLLYPIILDCCKHADDIFWDNIFEDLAYGKPPYGTYINKNFLCCNQKNKEFVYKIEEKDTIVLYTEIYDILTTKLGILSQKEKLSKKSSLNIDSSNKTWYDIKKKNTRELLIEMYIIRMRKAYTISLKDCRYLLSVIMIGLILKILSNDDITCTEGEIINIKGIHFTNRIVWIDFSLYDIKHPCVHTVPEESPTMIEEWYKYLKTLNR